jgi:hypothetical protein
LNVLEELKTRRRQQYVSAFQLALIHHALGEREATLAALETAHQEHAVEFTQVDNYYPSLKSLATAISGRATSSPDDRGRCGAPQSPSAR